jgi:hypothetical protein
MNSKNYYYWSKTYQNDKGETLIQCFDKYGTGVQNFVKDGYNLVMECVFLDEHYNYGHSWCMRLYQLETGKNIPVRLYEKNPEEKIYGHHDLNPMCAAANKVNNVKAA